MQARGFDDLSSTADESRIERWINQARAEIDDAYPWPYLEASEEGTAPLEVEDLGHVIKVADPNTETLLRYTTHRELADLDPTVNDTGTAVCWYREGTETIKVWPADTTTKFRVFYFKVAPDLEEAEDKPLSPVRFHDLIVQGALVRAYRNRDAFEASKVARAEFDEGMMRMVHSLLHPNYDFNRRVVKTGVYGDYL